MIDLFSEILTEDVCNYCGAKSFGKILHILSGGKKMVFKESISICRNCYDRKLESLQVKDPNAQIICDNGTEDIKMVSDIFFSDMIKPSQVTQPEVKPLQVAEPIKEEPKTQPTSIKKEIIKVERPPSKLFPDEVKDNLTKNLEQEIELIRSLAIKQQATTIQFVVPDHYESKFVTPEPWYQTEFTSDIEERRKINDNLDNENNPKEIYKYSGKGKLHDLDVKCFNNFYDYTKAKQDYEYGEFYTPDWLIKEMVNILEPEPTDTLVDPTCGIGRMFNYLPTQSVTGYDISDEALLLANKIWKHKMKGQANCCIHRGINEPPVKSWDYVIGNPPYNLYLYAYHFHKTKNDNGKILSQNAFIEFTSKALIPGGTMLAVFPQSFGEVELRDSKINEFINENFWRIAEIPLGDNVFNEYQIKFPVKLLMLMLRDPSFTLTEETYKGNLEGFKQSPIGRWYYAIKEFKKNSIRKGKLIHVHNIAVHQDELQEEQRQYKKAMFAYRHSKNYDMDQYAKFANESIEIPKQKKPWGLDEKIWQAREKTFPKLIKRIKRAISYHRNPNLVIKLHYAYHKIRLEASNEQVGKYLNTVLPIGQREIDLNKLLLPEQYPNQRNLLEEYQRIIHSAPVIPGGIVSAPKPIKVETFPVNKFVARKLKQYLHQRQPLEMIHTIYPEQYQKYREQIQTMKFPHTLMEHQVDDIARAAFKNHLLLAWEVGLGKTIGAIVWTKLKGGRTLVVSPAVNILDPWKEQLKEWIPDKKSLVLRSRKDVRFIEGDEDYVVCSLESMPSLYPFLKKQRWNNLVLDESDNIKTKSSTRAQHLKKLTKKVKRKLIMSGTPTRNNALEIYNQLELLSNNSLVFLDTVKEIQEYDRSSSEYDMIPNQNYMKPYPAFGGYSIFQKSFVPKKTTVFGASKTNQNLFNKKEIQELFKCFRLTRIFNEEKKGDNFEIKQVLVPMSQAEGRVYKFILDEFARQVEEYYSRIHDGATARMLAIMRQILALLQAVSHPWSFTAYDGPPITNKMQKVKEIIDETDDKVMFGSPWIPTVDKYEAWLTESGYKVFRIKSELSKLKRSAIINEFKTYEGKAILLGTIGCLKSGLNLPQVKTVITDSYPWNYATLRQFFARAIRINTKHKVTVYCLCSEGSFDVNVFALMLKKEQVNTYLRTDKEVSMDQLAEGFDTSTDIFDAALDMVKQNCNGEIRGKIEWDSSAILSE